MLEIERLDHVLITIPPNSRDEARKFYTEVLLLKEIPGNHPNGAIWVQLGDIELHIREEEIHQANSGRHPGLVVKDLDQAKAFLQKATIELSYSSVIEGRSRCFFRDPWGNRFELIEFDRK
ncbi:catechol 2,3-dioxygenase-like lactoylglutathione lyase family enzyme [Algoriphagus sp. 4150]|uniref:VOC family protein n=1 Tax=Algoriphagus sp. 4150 TaxID=2817756 RepID=UPI00285BEC9D|nr:VOC family protein [Algoriphagus sp. 4150]MDR7130505.1 catechol 2,3-dioxygenase-like lactoylglutathione lyase family enzyme [Algoriphagus sp. 4150]